MTRARKVLLVLVAVVLVPVGVLGGCAGLLTWSMKEHGRTELHTAAADNDIATIRNWIGRHKNLDSEMQFASNIEHAGDKGVTPLMLAARAGHSEAALLLLEAGARADARSYPPSFPEHGETVLEYAIEGGNPAILGAVLAKVGGALTAPERSTTLSQAFGSVCNHGYYDTPSATEPKDRLQVTRVVVALFPPTQQDLQLLASRAQNPQCPELIEVVLDQGVAITPAMLIAAARLGDAAVVRRLIASGADINASDPSSDERGDTTALLTAWRWQRAEVVDTLLAAKADANIPGRDGATLLHLLLAKPNREKVDLVNRLIDGVARTDIPDRGGQTAAEVGSGFTPRVDWGFSPQARMALRIPDPQRVEIIGGRPARAGCNNCPIEPPPATK